MMIDSTVLIDVLQENEAAKQFLLSTIQDLKISRVVVMEIIAGCKNKPEMKKSLKLITDLGLEIVEIEEQISHLAGELFKSYYHRFGFGITDAFIAATALTEGRKLITHNVKHFRFIQDLELVVPY